MDWEAMEVSVESSGQRAQFRVPRRDVRNLSTKTREAHRRRAFGVDLGVRATLGEIV